MNLAVAVRAVRSASGLYEKIGLAGDGEVVSSELLNMSKLRIVDISTQVEGAVARDMAVVQS